LPIDLSDLLASMVLLHLIQLIGMLLGWLGFPWRFSKHFELKYILQLYSTELAYFKYKTQEGAS
jgi:hypothetical protein